jgi:predicted RNA-binding Zn ribbon-like protein
MHAWQEHGLLGGHPALQFANTVDDPGKTRAQDGLPTWPLALDWAQKAELVASDELPLLRAAPDGAAELGRLHALREAIWRSFHAVADGAPPAESERATLAADGRAALAVARLTPSGRALVWRVDAAVAGAATLRARLALASLDLAADAAQLARLRECGRCTALFLDSGRGRGRRWCRMQTCGNRAKVQRHRARTR